MLRKVFGILITSSIIAAIIYGIWVFSLHYSKPIAISIVNSYIHSKTTGALITCGIELFVFALFVLFVWYVGYLIFRRPFKRRVNAKGTKRGAKK